MALSKNLGIRVNNELQNRNDNVMEKGKNDGGRKKEKKRERVKKKVTKEENTIER